MAEQTGPDKWRLIGEVAEVGDGYVYIESVDRDCELNLPRVGARVAILYADGARNDECEHHECEHHGHDDDEGDLE